MFAGVECARQLESEFGNDPKAYTHFFKIKKIKSVEISRFIRDKDPERFIYLMQIKT